MTHDPQGPGTPVAPVSCGTIHHSGSYHTHSHTTTHHGMCAQMCCCTEQKVCGAIHKRCSLPLAVGYLSLQVFSVTSVFPLQSLYLFPLVFKSHRQLLHYTHTHTHILSLSLTQLPTTHLLLTSAPGSPLGGRYEQCSPLSSQPALSLPSSWHPLPERVWSSEQ